MAEFLRRRMKLERFISTLQNCTGFTRQPFPSNTKKPQRTPLQNQIMMGLSESYRLVLKQRMNAYPIRRRLSLTLEKIETDGGNRQQLCCRTIGPRDSLRGCLGDDGSKIDEQKKNI